MSKVKGSRVSLKERLAGLGVHLFTACGAGLGFLALVAAIDRRFELCFAWLGVALLVDGADGALARRAHVAQTAGFIDGALLDLVVDYVTYVLVPLVAIWRSQLLPQPVSLFCAIVVAVCSALYFADRRMKTEDLWFRGFPACWNLIAFYLFVFRLPASANAAILLGATALMFAPIVSVHPFRVVRFRAITIAMSVVWLLAAGLALSANFHSAPAQWGLGLSGLYFVVLSLVRGPPE